MSTANQENFNLETPGEYIIKHVKGADEYTPRGIELTGRLDAPQAFVKNKPDYNAKYATVVIDSDAGTVTLTLNEKAQDADVITGKLEQDERVAALGINGATRYTPRELFNKFKRLPFLFADREEYAVIQGKLNKFTMQVKKAYEDSAANTGSAKKSLETVVEGFEPILFDLKIPVFKGDVPVNVQVEIAIDATGSEPKLFLDSLQLDELVETRKRELLDEQVEFFTTWGSSVVHQS